MSFSLIFLDSWRCSLLSAALLLGRSAYSKALPTVVARDLSQANFRQTSTIRTSFSLHRLDGFAPRLLGHVPEKLNDFSDKNMLQLIELERSRFDRAIPPDRKTL
ncbi:MAG: hypothetical protein ACYC5H_02990 [Methylovirgula sp.]